jgi:hypothetical protein
VVLHLDIVKNMLVQKKQTNGPIENGSTILPAYNSALSKRSQKDNKLSLDLDRQRPNLMVKANLCNIKEEEKESSFNILTLNDIEKGNQQVTGSKSDRNRIKRNSPSRNLTTSIFSKDTTFETRKETTSSKISFTII